MSQSRAVSIVIVNWNVRDLLRECLRSLEEQTCLAGNVEVIVVDNGSSDGSVEMIRSEFARVRLVVNKENQGFARANNQALPLCRGRYLILLNPDTRVLDRALTRLVSWMDAHPRAGIAGCRLLNTDGSFQRWTGGSF